MTKPSNPAHSTSRDRTRRAFLKDVCAAGAAGITLPLAFDLDALAAPRRSNEKLRVACVGVGGRGKSNVLNLAALPEVELACLCDIDQRALAAVMKEEAVAARWTDVPFAKDWRTMLRRDADRFDAVVVSTPDHTHAPIAMTALRADKHVYCEKPLGHSVAECRALAREAAARPTLVTQFGVQIHAHIVYRMGVAMIRSGMIGRVRAVHSWSGKGWAGPPERRPERADAVPDGVDWDLWLGPAPARPFVAKLYHPNDWRRWQDFGTGTAGDMACHILDPAFNALELDVPLSVVSKGPAPFEETWADASEYHFRFRGTDRTTETLDYVWFDGRRGPNPADYPLADGQRLPGAGSVFIGDKGCLLLPHWSAPRLLPAPEFKSAIRAFKKTHTFPKRDHHAEFVNACLGRGTTRTPFAYAAKLTESILLGLVAARFPGRELQWDRDAGRFTDAPDANRHLARRYREGWRIEGLG